MNKPMKGVDCLGNLDVIKYPKIAQPKYDGIRIIFAGGKAYSASLKEIRNVRIQVLAKELSYPLECEFVVSNADGGLRAAASYCNSFDGRLADGVGRLYAFDIMDDKRTQQERISAMDMISNRLAELDISIAPSTIVNNKAMVEAELHDKLSAGYEGIMLKDPNALYKHGRSTLRSQECLKLKPFVDDEAVVVGFDYEYENTNPAFYDELGRLKRSSAHEGLVPKPLVGSLLLLSPKYPKRFSVAGFSADLKERMFAERDSLIGRVVTFKHQPCVVYEDAPRHPIFRRFRPIGQ